MPAATDPNSLSLADFYGSLRHRGVRRLLELARDEDLGERRTDLAAEALAPPAGRVTFAVTARTPGTLAGLAAVPDLLEVYGGDVTLRALAEDGAAVTAGDTVATLSGDSAAVLRVERPLLNILSRLSGVATLTARFVERTAGTRAHVYDTRKTTPGLRALEKYAVRCGGGRSHRLGLDDAAMFKDNHLAGVTPDRLAEVIGPAAMRARAAGAAFIEVEVDTLEQLAALLTLPAGTVEYVLLDNMPPEVLRQAVAMRDAAGSAVELEASGGITLDTARAIAETGVERLSTGAITHSALPIDFGLDAQH